MRLNFMYVSLHSFIHCGTTLSGIEDSFGDKEKQTTITNLLGV